MSIPGHGDFGRDFQNRVSGLRLGGDVGEPGKGWGGQHTSAPITHGHRGKGLGPG